MSREGIIAGNPIADFVRSRGHELRRAGQNFVTGGCPVAQHKRGHRPVMIYPETQSWSCHDCKKGGSVIDWMMHERGCDAAQAIHELSGNNGASEIVANYDYTDEGGNLIFQCVRSKPKDFWQRRPNGKGGWINNLQGVRRVLYRLPEVIAASTVCLPEGEKDCDNLAKLGFVATTNPLGAGKWRDEYSETLRGKDVVVFGDVGDKDGTGEKHTQHRIESLTGTAKSIKHVTLPDGFHDVSDYIASLPPDKAGEIIRRLIDETPEIEPHSSGTSDTAFPPTPYLAPPLTLLPKVLKDYVRSAAESLNVDVAYILLPLLSSLGSATGNSRSILLKPGFIQPPVIWTGIVGRSGSRKSPALEAGCFAVMEHERELMQENRSAQTDSEARLGEWESKSKKDRGIKPDSPPLLTCVLDDLTIEVLTDVHVGNPRGVLVRKDELSHWVASFDQYRSSKGSDVARWLSLHTAVFLAVDRRTDNRHHRISLPRVCITGGIQPQILRRVLTQEFFERGLPARFLFGYPPFIPDKWTEATIPDRVRADALDLFNELWLLQPNDDDRGEPSPKLLRLDAEAKAVFVEFYNECGAVTLEASEHEEAAWCKLTGYAARLALVGQLARDPNAATVTGDTMRAACDLARWFGNEATRIYAELAETREQREQRELCEFIERRGGSVRVRDLMQSYAPLKNQKEKAESALNELVKIGRGKWADAPPHGAGRPTREFHLLRLSTSTQFGALRGKGGNSVDVDGASSQKITPSGEPERQAVSDELDAMPAGIFEL